MDNTPKVLPLVWLLLAVLTMLALHRYGPVATYLAAPWTWIGLVPLLFGLWMTIASAAAFRRVETGLVPFSEASHLVTTGFFRYSRNPMYLGMVFCLAGLSMTLGTVATMLPVPVFAWIIDRNFIRAEERFMRDRFGDQYLAYQRRVRRWL